MSRSWLLSATILCAAMSYVEGFRVGVNPRAVLHTRRASCVPRAVASVSLPPPNASAEASTNVCVPSKGKAAKRAAAKGLVTVGVWSLLSAAAIASGGEGHLHIGQKLALFLQGSGLPAEVILMIVSALPVVELRGGVPVGIWMGLPVAKTAVLAVIGNMMPIIPLLLALRSPLVRKLMKPILERAESKAAAFGDESTRARGLALFVGIPLPGTGAWTGAMGAFLLGMPFAQAVGAIFSGVVMAAGIMSLVTVSGTIGGVIATAFLVAVFLAQTRR